MSDKAGCVYLWICGSLCPNNSARPVCKCQMIQSAATTRWMIGVHENMIGIQKIRPNKIVSRRYKNIRLLFAVNLLVFTKNEFFMNFCFLKKWFWHFYFSVPKNMCYTSNNYGMCDLGLPRLNLWICSLFLYIFQKEGNQDNYNFLQFYHTPIFHTCPFFSRLR